MIPARTIVKDSAVRYINNDQAIRGERIWFAVGEYQQNVMVTPKDQYRGKHLYFPSRQMVEEIIEHFDEITGLPIPDLYLRGLNVHLVPGVLSHGGMTVPSRVLRQQIFFGGLATPYTEEQVHMIMFAALGNTLWNFLDYRIWGGGGRVSEEESESGIDFAEKNEYRALRNYALTPGTGNRAQRDLFYVASEDFRYLFGTVAGRRGEWFLPDDVIGAPNPEVVNFWRKELLRDPNQRA